MPWDFHPLANIFPLIEGQAFDELVADVRANGLQEIIDIYQGKILDGRNRYRAAEAAGIEIERRHIRNFQPEFYGDALAYVISKNLKRRHLNDDQRRLVAARLANLAPGRPITEKIPQNAVITREDAARILSVDEAGVERAKAVLAKAAPEIQAAVERGKLTVAAAAKSSKLAEHIQRKIAVAAEAGDLNAARNVIKRETRAVRERDLGAKQRALPQQKFGCIVADPEWHDEVWSEETGMDRHAGNHYPTSTQEIIASRDVPSIAADDCVLGLWTTNQHLRIAMAVMEAWGFIYKSNYCWGKDRISLGRWNRGKHELLLIGTRGQPPCPAPGTQFESLIMAAKGEHSAKPDIFLEMFERYYPTLPKIELNRRGSARPGWAAWGNESESNPEAA